MIKVEHVEVFNWEGAIRGLRNSWGSHDKSDSCWEYSPFEASGREYLIGPKDLGLMMKLSKAGDSHGKFLRQIMVSCDITADCIWWGEADTYKVGTTANSTSTMHTFGRNLSPASYGFDDFNDLLIQQYYAVVKQAVSEWIDAGSKTGTYEWRRMMHLNARAFLYTRHLTLNYQVLKNMYHDRKAHRYKEWHYFCDWIRSLPHSFLITLEEKKDSK